MYPRIMPFCLLLKFSDKLKAKYQLHLGMTEDVKFECAGEYITGTISCWEDNFPIRYQCVCQPEFSVERHQMCNWLIHNGVASAIPKILTIQGTGTIHFTHRLPSDVNPQDILLIGPFVYLHDKSPSPISIKD
jgi:hypothetical protein